LVLDFLGRVFDPSRKRTAVDLRGYYFSSGTQEGTPIDQVLGAIGTRLRRRRAAASVRIGQSFFLHDLLAKVAFAESNWVSRNESVEKSGPHAGKRDGGDRTHGRGGARRIRPQFCEKP
jgi:type VI secretion system protein ImpL